LDVLEVDSRFAAAAAVPEPASLALVAAGVALLFCNKRRRLG
jgi:hypothetical protein